MEKILKLSEELELLSKKLHLTFDEKKAFDLTIKTLNFYYTEIEEIKRGNVNE